ncbi:hypothetical protein HU200_031501 [Digitaria exilis]|uniref:FAE domain-containing protein n=1 Tax=Digitaria exilis TaxID=1010633 RepID=A0A835BM36_9POAL|nr:hypothetical protein HU200_031501 [Digitaria exilis]
MYILQEIPSPQSRTVDLTVRNNLSISWTKDRKYPYPNPGTHPHVGPTSGDHPQVRFFGDTRFRSDDDHFLDLSLLLRESHELNRSFSPAAPPPFKTGERADRAPAALTGGRLAGGEVPRPRHRAQQHCLATPHTPSPKTPWRPSRQPLRDDPGGGARRRHAGRPNLDHQRDKAKLTHPQPRAATTPSGLLTCACYGGRAHGGEHGGDDASKPNRAPKRTTNKTYTSPSPRSTSPTSLDGGGAYPAELDEATEEEDGAAALEVMRAKDSWSGSKRNWTEVVGQGRATVSFAGDREEPEARRRKKRDRTEAKEEYLSTRADPGRSPAPAEHTATAIPCPATRGRATDVEPPLPPNRARNRGTAAMISPKTSSKLYRLGSDVLSMNLSAMGCGAGLISISLATNLVQGTNILTVSTEFVSLETYNTAEESLRTNYYGTKHVTEALLPLLKSSSDGRIVNVSSGFGLLRHFRGEELKQELNDADNLTEERLGELMDTFLKDFEAGALEARGWPGVFAAYKVAKAAVNAYSRIMARRHPALRVNCAHPGFVKTDMTRNAGLLTPEEGASNVVKVALLPAGEPTGVFFAMGKEAPFL